MGRHQPQADRCARCQRRHPRPAPARPAGPPGAAGAPRRLHRHPAPRQLRRRVLRRPLGAAAGDAAARHRQAGRGSSQGQRRGARLRSGNRPPRQHLRHEPRQSVPAGAGGHPDRARCPRQLDHSRPGRRPARRRRRRRGEIFQRPSRWRRSELVVRSGHSTQSYPPTIEEVRRILLRHLAEACPALPACARSNAVAAR